MIDENDLNKNEYTLREIASMLKIELQIVKSDFYRKKYRTTKRKVEIETIFLGKKNKKTSVLTHVDKDTLVEYITYVNSKRKK